MSHIEKRRNLWYATLKVPEGLRQSVGKTKFLQSLGTADKRRAEVLAAPVVALWKARLRQAEGEPDAVKQEALRWRAAVEEARAGSSDDTAFAVESLLIDKAEQLADVHGEDEAAAFAAVALGSKTPSDLHLAEWKASIVNLAQKTQDQATKDVARLVGRFATLEDITPQAARRWLDQLQKEGVSPSSLKRMLTFWRSYWRHLESVDAVVPNAFPFVYRAPRAPKNAPTDSWVPFPAADVPRLWRAAEEGEDATLADLIRLGAHSGARIEELCSLKVEDVKPMSFVIRDSKTAAGLREVPIHDAVAAMVKARREASDDGYLFDGLTFNK